MKYTPTADRVLVELEPMPGYWNDESGLQGGLARTDAGDSLEQEQEQGLLVRPDSGDEMPLYGTIRARGPGRWAKKGLRRVPMDPAIVPGQRVIIPWATGTELTIGGIYHREVCEGDILAFAEDEAA